MDILRGKRILLRPVEIQDLDVLYRLENDSENWALSNHLNPFSRFYLEQYILHAENNIYTDKQLRLIIVDQQGTPLGIIDLFEFDPHHRRAALGIIIDPEFRNKGFASEALALIIRYASKVLNIKQLYCGIGAWNKISIRLFEKHGFKITGNKKSWRLNKGQWEDEHFLQLIFE